MYSFNGKLDVPNSGSLGGREGSEYSCDSGLESS